MQFYVSNIYVYLQAYKLFGNCFVCTFSTADKVVVYTYNMVLLPD
jgi:hypothetical protein